MATIESLDDTLMHYILRFLCGDSNGQHVNSYAADLIRCERVCRWFQRLVADDKLWGYWSVVTASNSNSMYLTVPYYGPENEYYDSRFESWRDLTLCKSVCTRARLVMRKSADSEVFGFGNESNITYHLADCVFRSEILPHLQSRTAFIRFMDRLDLREDSAQMLFTLVGEYVLDFFKGANHIACYCGKKNENSYPVIDSHAMNTAGVIRARETEKTIDWTFPIPTLDLTRERDHEFDLLIRRIAYRAGVVKLDDSAFWFARMIYCNRLYKLLRDACIVLEEDDCGIFGSELKKITHPLEAYRVHPGVRFLQGFECTADECYCGLVFSPVPAQFEDINRRLESTAIRHKVYGVDGTTGMLENLENYYSFVEPGEDGSDFSESEDDDDSDDDDESKTIGEVFNELESITNKLHKLKDNLLASGRLDQDALSNVVSKLTKFEEEDSDATTCSCDDDEEEDEDGNSRPKKRLKTGADTPSCTSTSFLQRWLPFLWRN